MKKITKDEFVSVIKGLILQANYFLPEDFLKSIKTAIENETDELAKDVLIKILNNAEVASKTKLPLCQDTGIPEFFIQIGKDVCFDFNPTRVIQETVEQVYNEEKFRCSCVLDPVRRIGSVHYSNVYIEYTDEIDSKCKVSVLIRGGGSENTSVVTSLLPTTDVQEIVSYITTTVTKLLPYTCPPAVVGIGIGGTIEESVILAKKSLLRKMSTRNKNYFYAELENQIKLQLNNSGIGPLGLGGKTSVIDVFIETSPTHIATLPVSIVLQCHSYRRHTVVL